MSGNEPVVLRVLGPIRLVGPDGEHTVVGAKARAVLAVLGLHLNEVVPVERLIEDLWDGDPPTTARNTVQVYVSAVRRGLEAVGGPLALERTSGGYRLTGRRAQVDGLLFADLREQARSADPASASVLLARATGLWAGPPLYDASGTPLHRRLAPILDDARDGAIAEHGALERHRALEQHRAGPLRAAPGFVGRRTELTDIATLLPTDGGRDTRGPGTRGGLVTVAGLPGSGKSRLALEFAERWPGRAIVVRLETVTDPDDVVAAVADACAPLPGAVARLPPVDQIRHAVTGGNTLLVLDNCEQVAAACAALVAQLADAGPVRVLATSTRALAAPAETVYRLAPLPVPPPGVTTAREALAADSVVLFCDRARAVRPEFALTDALAPTVAEICRAVDGLPLSIELAGGRTSVLTPAELVERLGDQLRVLRALRRTRSRRHDSLASALTASVDGLSAGERALYAELARFAGPFTLRAAEAVVAGLPDVLDLLHGLVDASLVNAEVSGPEARFRMLEAVRQFGRTLPAAPDFDERRARYLAALARDAAAGRHGPDRARWQFRLDTARPDLAATLDRAVADARFDVALPLVADLWWWWGNTSPRAGLGWYRRVLGAAETAGVPAELLLHAQLAAAVIASFAEPAEALGYAEQALANADALDDRPAMARASQQLADIAYELGDLPRARSAGGRAWHLAHETGDRYAIGRCGLLLAYNALAVDDVAQARRWARDASEEFAAAGDPGGVAESSLLLAELLVIEDRPDEALASLTRDLATFRARRNDGQTARAATLLAIVTAHRGGPVDALLAEAFDRHADVGHPWAVAHDLDLLATALARRADPDDRRRAALLVGAARAVRAGAGLAPLPHDLGVERRVLDACGSEVGGPDVGDALRQGESGDLAAAIDAGRTALRSGPGQG